MANWCSNTVIFEGEPGVIGKVHELFKTMRNMESNTGRGQMPEFIKDVINSFFFDIYVDEEGGSINFETKWVPNIEEVRLIADHFGVCFELDYEESGMLLYGRVVYDGKEQKDVYLIDDDFDKYEMDEEKDEYLFEGNLYDNVYEIKDILLKRKLKSLSL